MIKVCSFALYLYGFLVGLGILAGFWVATRMVNKFKIRNSKFKVSSSEVWDALWWVFIPGVLGARLYHVLDFWEYYRENLILIPAVWTGGLGIFGAIFGGVIGLYFLAVQQQISDSFGVTLRSLMKVRTLNFSQVNRRFLEYLDLLAFGLPVGQAIGRWGNLFNQELYGKPTELPWGIPISVEHRAFRLSSGQAAGLEQHTHFHPLFLYESIYSILVFGLLLWLWRAKGAKLAAGSYFASYLVLYGVGRFFLEDLRIESWTVNDMNIAKTLGVLMVFVGVVILYSKNSK